MVRLILVSLVLAWLFTVVSCSDLSTSPCDPNVDAIDPSCEPPYFDPPAQTLGLPLVCLSDPFNAERPFFSVEWELTVDPGPIVSGEAFGAVLGGTLVIDARLSEDGLELAVPSKRSRLLETRLTVHVRDGVGPTDDVVLTHDIQPTCTYDANGQVGLEAGPEFPTCSHEHDLEPGGANTDCTGLGGSPDPENPCGEFTETPHSEDCAGRCTMLGEVQARHCEEYGFCVTGPVRVPLRSELKGYLAHEEGEVLFGWDDSLGPDLPPPMMNDSTYANGFRAVLQGSSAEFPFAFHCQMGLPPDITPVFDGDLVTFEIQQPVF